MTTARYAREDFVGRLGPHERLWTRVGDVDIASDGGFQFAGAPVYAAAQLLLCQRREPPFDEIDPRTARRREVHVKARAPHQPAMDHRRLVGARIINNEVDVKPLWHRLVEGVEESPKLPPPLPPGTLAHDLPAL